MSRGFTLHAARARDAHAMARILAEWIAETPWFESTAPASASRLAMAQHVRGAHVVVARAGGWRRRILGFGVRDGQAVAALYVARGARRRGIGHALLQALAAGQDALHLTSFVANSPALEFYAAIGCQQVGQTQGDNEEGMPDLRLLYPAQPQRMIHG